MRIRNNVGKWLSGFDSNREPIWVFNKKLALQFETCARAVNVCIEHKLYNCDIVGRPH